MSTTDDHTPDSNVIDFGRRTGLTGFNLTPVPPADGADTLGPVIPELPAGETGTGTGERGRRSPLDLVGALPSPALLAPPVPAATSPEPGSVPAAFRSDTGDTEPSAGPRLGALSLAAGLAVAVAALRGAAILLEDRRQRRMEKRAETAPLREAKLKHQLAMAQHGWDAEEAAAKGRTDVAKAREKAAGKGGKNRVPSGTEFGRKTLGGGRGGSSTGGRGGGLGLGSGRGGSKSGTGGSGRGGGKSSSGLGTGAGAGSKSSRSSRGTGAGGSGLGGGRKNRPSTGSGSGSSGRGLGTAAKTKKGSTGGGSHSGGGTGPGARKNRGSGTGSGLGLGGDSSRKHGKGTDSHGAKGGTGKHSRTSPHRTTQGAGGSLTKHKPSKNNHGRGSGHGGRTTLPKALKQQAQQAADKRLNARRTRLDKPAVWKKDPHSAGGRGSKTPKDGGGGKRKPDMSKLRDALWNDTKNAAGGRWQQRGRSVPPLWKNTKQRQKKTSGPTPGPSGKKTGPQTPKAPGGPRRTGQRRKARDRARKAWNGWNDIKGDCFGTTTPPHTDPGQNPGSARAGGPRRSPYGNAASANSTVTVTVERADRPTHDTTGTPAALTRGIDALPAAPTPHTQRPGTTAPPPAAVPRPARKEQPRMTIPRPNAGPDLDPEHASEITLDDALDALGDLKDDAFTTHTRCNTLADRARTLRNTLETLAVELRTKHNVWGNLFGAAMKRLSESMEVLARMSEEMESSSLEAAEMAETADNELNDAYRPISQATADANLSTPSAPIHNYT